MESRYKQERYKLEKYIQYTFISTIDSKLRHFQYKFLMRIIPTNVLLLKYKIKNSNL